MSLLYSCFVLKKALTFYTVVASFWRFLPSEGQQRCSYALCNGRKKNMIHLIHVIYSANMTFLYAFQNTVDYSFKLEGYVILPAGSITHDSDSW